jgi:hypothetical protein
MRRPARTAIPADLNVTVRFVARGAVGASFAPAASASSAAEAVSGTKARSSIVKWLLSRERESRSNGRVNRASALVLPQDHPYSRSTPCRFEIQDGSARAMATCAACATRVIPSSPVAPVCSESSSSMCSTLDRAFSLSAPLRLNIG